MIIYLDTSAVLPILVHEPSSASCLEIWDVSDDAVTSRLTYVETAAALARALRSQRMTTHQHRATLTQLDALWAQLDVIDLDQPLAVMAGSFAHDHGLRGYDAVHFASAAQLRDDELIAVSGDRKLLRAWTTLGLDTFDVNAGLVIFAHWWAARSWAENGGPGAR